MRIQVDEYRLTPDGAFSEEVLLISDLLTDYTINDEEYTGLGSLMDIGITRSELRPSSGTLDITISGIPNDSLAEILYSNIKGSPVRVYRVLFNPSTGVELAIDENPYLRYRGFINNYSLVEEYDNATKTSSNTIILNCASSLDVLNEKIAGRLVNPESQKKYYPLDVSMDRVPALENSSFDFGAPK